MKKDKLIIGTEYYLDSSKNETGILRKFNNSGLPCFEPKKGNKYISIDGLIQFSDDYNYIAV